LKETASKNATLLGLGALFMWAVEPLLVTDIKHIPIFQLLTIIFSSSFAVTSIRTTINGNWHTILKQSPFTVFIGILGVCGSDYAYIKATQLASVAHVDLIDYLWPCFAIFFSSFMPKERVTLPHLIGAGISIFGIYTLLGAGEGITSLKIEFIYGYALALFGAFLWGGYTVFTRYMVNTPSDMIGIYCGFGALISLILHLTTETHVPLSGAEYASPILFGIMGAGIAYQFWDYAVKHGNLVFLSICTYASRSSGVFLLVLFGKEPFSNNLIIACVLTTLGAIVSNLDMQAFNRYWSKLQNALSPSVSTSAREEETVQSL